MKPNHYCGKGLARPGSNPEQMLAKIQAATEEMTIHRYVHTIPKGETRCQRGQWEHILSLERELREQNRILRELVQAVKALTRAMEGSSGTKIS